MSVSLLLSLLPIPVSISTKPSSCSTSRHRKASGMRLRSSGGARRAQSAFGTMPNMAPPSRCWVPASRAWQVRRPTLKVVESAKCRDSVGLGESQQAPQAFRRRDRIARGPVPPLDFNAEVIAHRIEISARQVGEQVTREPDRADPRYL